MIDGAMLKVHRAAKHIDELNNLIRKERPFIYVVETNAQTGDCTMFSKENEPVIGNAACICGDAVHNLRSALDHAYWDIVSPVVTSDGQRKNIQFPFTEKAARLEEAAKNRLAHLVSDRFFRQVVGLRLHSEAGGNELLWSLHEIDLLDKHKLLTPVADYARVISETVQRQVPGFPSYLTASFVGGAHVTWQVEPSRIDRNNIGEIRTPSLHIFERELDIPIDIVIAIRSQARPRPLIPFLNDLLGITKEAIAIMRGAAG